MQFYAKKIVCEYAGADLHVSARGVTTEDVVKNFNINDVLDSYEYEEIADYLEKRRKEDEE